MNETDILNSNYVCNEDIYKEINKDNKISAPILTKYERTKIIGISAQQIQGGRKPSLDIPNNITNPLDIAEYELVNKKTPFIIKRKLPNNIFEYYTIEQLEII